MIPGDPARVMAGTDADAAGLEEIRAKYGLNDPIPILYLRWAGLALQGDLGRSIRTRDPVMTTVARKLPITVELAGLSVLIALAIAIPAGVLAAVRRNTAWDLLASGASLCGVSVPNFWLGIMLILFFSVRLGWLPASGFVSFWESPSGNLRRMIMPAFVLGTALAAVLMRQTRNSMIGVLGADYIRTAYSKGLAGRAVIFRHAIRNSLIPVVTILGLQAGARRRGACRTAAARLAARAAPPGVGGGRGDRARIRRARDRRAVDRAHGSRQGRVEPDPQGAERGASVRHGRPRPGQLRARGVGQPHLDAGGRLLDPAPHHRRRAPRPPPPLLSPPPGPGDHAAHRRLARLPLPDPGHRPRDDHGSVAHQRHHRDRAGRDAHVHPPHARPRALDGGRGLRAGRARARRRRRAPHGPPHPAEHLQLAARAGHRLDSDRDHRGGGALVPRAGRAAPHAELGHHAQRRAAVPRVGAVDGMVAGARDLLADAGLQPRGRRPARPPRPQGLLKWGAPKWPPIPPHARRAPAKPWRASTSITRCAPGEAVAPPHYSRSVTGPPR